MANPLVTTEWLAAHVQDPDVQIVDCRWYLAPFDLRDPAEEFEKGHLPGAIHMRWDRDYHDPDHELGGMLAPSDRFAEVMSAAGIGDKTLVVAYDDNHVTVAARLWWALRTYGHDRVVVLDGGYRRWVDEGRPVSTAAARPTPAVFTPRFRHDLYATKADVLAAVGNDSVQLVDGRMRGAYEADGGSVPGSARFGGIDFVKPDGSWSSPTEIRSQLSEGNALDTEGVIAYCTGGVGACGTALAYAIAGREDVAMYDGSWTEWGSDPTTPKVANPGQQT